MNNNYIIHWGIPGMKWGVRRYRNKDGSLTPAGERRYNRTKTDPDKWVREDLVRTKNLTKEAKNLTQEAANLNRLTTSTRSKSKRMDLSKMTDKEMRDKINRELLERQYDQLFNEMDKKNTRRGREIVGDTLAIAGATLGVAGSSLGIALAIKELKG